MRLFVQALEREVGKLEEQGVRLHVIGDLSAFEPRLQELIFAAQQRTAHNDRLHLTVAANYGGRWDILQATRAMLAAEPDLAAHPERIDEAHLSRHLSMSWAPEPDLFIRTGGEQRISNFLIWQMAYAEFYFTDRYWPDFGAAELQAAFDWYRTRERRFGRTSAQVNGDDRNRPPSARLSGQHKRRPSHVGPAYRYRRYSVGHPGRRHDERQSLVVRRPARAGRGLRQWEWLRLTLSQPPSPLICAGVPVLLFAAMLALSSAWLGGAGPGWADPRWILGYAAPAVAAVWLFGGVTAVVRGQSSAPPASLGWSLFSVPAAFVAWAVLAQMYIARGAAFVVSLLALVWVADIAAYFAGRAFGKRKLAPRVSPGKTIAGAVAGVLGAVVWIGLSSLWDGTYGHALVARWSFWLALPLAAALGVLSIIGDLFESLLKRRAGRKDSSALLPGHGGVYDRIDAILPVAPFALILSGVLS